MANDRQVCNRNAGQAAHRPVHHGRNERMLPPFTGHLLAEAALGRADRVALIGYGTRPITRAAGSAAIDGQARALDLSAAMPRQATRRAQEEGLANVCFEHDDAQVYRFTPGAGDLALSRMGVMLLAGPAARVRQHGPQPWLPAPTCLRVLAEPRRTERIVVADAAVAPRVPLSPLDDHARAAPFSLGQRSRIGTVLRAAALSDIAIEHRG